MTTKARTKTASKKTSNGITWNKSVVRFECQTYRADVPVGLLVLKDGNPVGRHSQFVKSPYKTKRFQAAIEESDGPVGDIIVTGFRPDATFQVVDGNSRAAAAVMLYGENYLVSVTLVEGADADLLYGLLNHAGGGRPISAKDKPKMLLEHPKSLVHDEKALVNLTAARTTLGEEAFIEFANSGFSYDLYRRALTVSQFCGWGREGTASVMRWMLRYCKRANFVEQFVIRKKLYTPEQLATAIIRGEELQPVAVVPPAPATSRPQTVVVVNQ